MDYLRPEAFFDLESFRYRDLFSGCRYVWEALGNISTFTRERTIPGALGDVNVFGRPLPKTLVLWRGRVWDEGFELLGGDVTKGAFCVRIQGEETTEGVVLYAGSVLMDGQICLGAGSVVEPGALIKGPTLIGAYTEVRQGAYVRGTCIVGDRCVVGHTTEMKGSVMLDGAKAGHFAYIGDSILGRLSNLGAGTKLANLKIGGSEVSVRVRDELIGTGLRKFGAILGDNVELGCNSVTNPGTLIGKGSIVFPLTSVRACYYDPDSVIH